MNVIHQELADIPPLSIIVGPYGAESRLNLRSAILRSDEDMNVYEAGHVVAAVGRVVLRSGDPSDLKLVYPVPGKGLTCVGGDISEIYEALQTEMSNKMAYHVLNLLIHQSEGLTSIG